MPTHAMDNAPWDARIAQLGQVVDLEASARSHGALQRRRQVRLAVDLLRLYLAYVLGRLSLRGLSAWAAAQGWAAHPRPAFGGLGTRATMSDVAPSSTGCEPAPTGWA